MLETEKHFGIWTWLTIKIKSPVSQNGISYGVIPYDRDPDQNNVFKFLIFGGTSITGTSTRSWVFSTIEGKLDASNAKLHRIERKNKFPVEEKLHENDFFRDNHAFPLLNSLKAEELDFEEKKANFVKKVDSGSSSNESDEE